MTAILEIKEVDHAYVSNRPVLRGLSFSVNAGEIRCLLGPSGCGKTTALRVIAGFESITSGLVRIKDRTVNEPGFTIPPEKRQVGVVFQDAALFPHLNIEANIQFGLQRLSREAARSRVAEMIGMAGLGGLNKRYPHELSGGQRQRAALARAMAPNPALILLDEPFSSLDADLRTRLSAEIRSILKKSGMTAVLVTHDQKEAFVMADQVCVMNQGQIQQDAVAQDLYHRPANLFVAGFIGEGVFIEGAANGDGTAQLELGTVIIERDFEKGCPVKVLIRPEHVTIDAESGVNALIKDVQFRGIDSLATLTLPSGQECLALASGALRLKPGDRVKIRPNSAIVPAFPRS